MKLKFFRSLLAMAGLAAFALPAGATKYAGEFMKIAVGARAVGMGSAFSAVADDATSPFWNPAGMVYLPYKEVFLEHNEQFGNLVNHNFGSAVWPMKNGDEHRSALGISGTWVGVDDIPITPRPGGLDPHRLSSLARQRPDHADPARTMASGSPASGCSSPATTCSWPAAPTWCSGCRSRASAAGTSRGAAR
jgi:hypothetical protein